MNYYNRESNEWYDEKVRDNFKQISRGKYINHLEYFSKTNSITTYVEDFLLMYIKIGIKKPLKAIFNLKYDGKSENIDFSFQTYDKSLEPFIIDLKKSHKKKEYDGTYTFTVDVSNIYCNSYIQLNKESSMLVTFNYLTVEFEESFLYFDFKSYKEAISKFF